MAEGKNQAPLTLAEAMAGLPAEFAFFADRYRTEVQPRLAGREAERAQAAAKAKRFAWIGAALAAVIALGGLAFQSFVPALIGAFAGFGLYGWASLPLNRLAKETKLALIEPVAGEFGMAYELAPDPPAAMSRFRNLGLVGSWDRARYEDRLTGKRGDADYEFYEAHLEEKRTSTDSRGRTQTRWVTIFRGQCLVADFHKPFDGVTKVFRDAGVLNAFIRMGQREERVRLEDPVFEKAFEVYAGDQVEARFILTPDFMERLLDLERVFGGKKLRCAFSGGEMLLAVEGKNLFEAGSMYKPLDDPARVREMLADFAAMFSLIDAMTARRLARAPAAPTMPGA
jgi:hypothetical protein